MATCSEGIGSGSSPSSLEDSDSIANTLDERFLQCPIHLERYVKPKMLPCLHSVCCDCLEQWVEKKDGILECPECRKEHPIPGDGIKGLPDNFHLNNLIEFLQKVGSKRHGSVERESATHTCGPCKKSDEIDLWCIDCAFYLCSTCIPIHNTMAVDHDTISIEEFNQLSDSEKIHLKPVYCDKHPKFKVEFFCKTCELPVCSKCTIVQHKAPDHSLEEIEDTYSMMCQDLKEQIKRANKKKGSANGALDTMQHVQEELQEQRIQALEEAENHVAYLKAMIDMNMNIMRMEIEQDYQKKEAVLVEWRSKMAFFSKEITEGVYFAENLLKFGNFMTVTTTSKQASVRLKSLITESIPKQAKYDFKVQFFPNQELFDEVKEVSIGSVEKQEKLLEKAKDATCPKVKKKGTGVCEEHAEGVDQENWEPDSDDWDKSKPEEFSNDTKDKRKSKNRGKKKEEHAGRVDQENMEPDSDDWDWDKSKAGESSTEAKDKHKPKNRGKKKEEHAGGVDQENMEPDSDDWVWDWDKSKAGESSTEAKDKHKPKNRGKKKKKQSIPKLTNDGDVFKTDTLGFGLSCGLSLTSYSKSFIINANAKKPCAIGKEINLRLLMKNEHNQPFRESPHNRSILVKVERPNSGGIQQSIAIQDRGNDQCHIKFTPFDIGVHKIFVKINGEKIKRYPYSLNVSTGPKSTIEVWGFPPVL